jgi:hypothetical protein
MKIFNNNKNKSLKIVTLKNSNNTIGKVKLLPSYSKEWKNIVFHYNKSFLKNILHNNLNINKIIQWYFNLYLKDNLNLVPNVQDKKLFRRWVKKLARKGRTFSKIFVSKAEVRYINNKAKITLYIINREKKIFKFKYFSLNKILIWHFITKRYNTHYQENIIKIFNLLNKFNYKYIMISSILRKKSFFKYKLENLNKFLKFKKLYIETMIYHIVNDFLKKYSEIIVKYESNYSLTQWKLSNTLLPKLSYFLNNVLEKKVEFNLINLKSIVNNTDIFTNMLGKLIRKRKNMSLAKDIGFITRKIRLPKVNRIKERTPVAHNIDGLLMEYSDSKLVSNIVKNNDITSIINNYNRINNNQNKIHREVFNSINYKNMSGLRMEIKGRLTKRYRADRAIYRLKYRGGLRNVYSSYQGLSSVLFRGNSKSNTSYSLFKSKRRIGSFAIKGWIGGK